MENIFRYEGHKLYAEVSEDMLPKAVSLIKSYLASRLYSEEEKLEDKSSFFKKTVDRMPTVVALQVNPVMFLMKRDRALQAHKRAAVEIEEIPKNGSYKGDIDITRGYRPANIAELRFEINDKRRATIELYFGSEVGDETRPLIWMQYDALLKKVAGEGFAVDRGSMDQEVEAFKVDDSTYFRTGPINEVMSAFDWSELESVVNFLWSDQLPEDMKAKLRR